ncbi:MAG: pacearchaeosortase [Candidatus Pacearchaeota archaeon]|nr:pacearchaeosortase [Candidatus Pacearchaeota archaeon]
MEGQKEGWEILSRYLLGVIVSIVSISVPIFYWIFRPLTVWPTFFVLDIFYEPLLNGIESIAIGNFNIEIVDACIAGSAYLLLFILNVLTREISFKKRIFVFVFDIIILLWLNILRLVLMVILLVSGSSAFDFTHKFFWYVLSTVLVAAVWLFGVWIFKIKAIPFYSDVKFLLNKKTKNR